MTDYRANTLEDAYNVCDVRPLEGEDSKKYYYDLSKVRKTEAINRVKLNLKLSKPEQNQTILSVKGCYEKIKAKISPL